MQNSLKKYFLIWISSLVVILVIYAFLVPVTYELNTKAVDFTTTQSSELYFKNIRSFSYNKQELAHANTILYRIKSRERDSVKNKLSFVLVHNWLLNQCFIRAESGLFNLSQDLLLFEFQSADSTSLYTYTQADATIDYQLGAILYNQLEAEAAIQISLAGEASISLSEKELQSIHMSMKDYFKLIGKIR